LRRVAPLLAVALLVFQSAESRGEPRRTELQERRGDVRERIDALRRDLARSEESRSDAADRLREIETAISAANRKLRELGREREAVEQAIAGLERESRRLDAQSAGQQAQLEHLLRNRFSGGETDALRTILSGEDPNQAARDRHFLALLAQAKAELIRELRGVAAKKRELAARTRDRQEQLRTIAAKQEAGREQMLSQQKSRQSLLHEISGKITAQRRELGALKRDEQRLGRLIASLPRASRQAAHRAEIRRDGGEDRPADGPKVSPGGTAPPSAPAASRGSLADADPGAVGEFGALRGRLRLPAQGQVTGRFGTPRGEVGTLWRGVFIRAAEGSEVHAVAAGTVVHADWLRGFGNLLIVDHGDDFLSIYGNNQSLLHGVGERVKSGETIATVGSTGGNPEPGLYFELRHRGQPFDPLKWTRR